MVSVPAFGLLWANYPTDHDPEAVKRMIGGRVNLPWLTNTCTIRLSYAFNRAGSPIPKRHPSLSTVEGGDGHWYAFRVREFKRYLAASTINPRDADAHYQLGLIHLQRRQLDEAADRFTRAVAIDPREIDAQYQLGRLAREQGRFEEARTHFDAVVSRDVKHASHEVWREIGATYLESDSFDHAKWALEKFVAERPHDPEGLYRLGVALQRLGQGDAAQEMFRRSVESVDTMPRYLQRKAGPWRKLASAALSTDVRRPHGA